MMNRHAFDGMALLMLASILQQSSAWVIRSRMTQSVGPHFHRRVLLPSSSTNLAMVQSVTLTSLEDHEAIGDELARSVQRWLDNEWMPQDVHLLMGQSCKKSYVTCREAGVDDLMTIMTTVADNLTNQWAEFDKDAFVGAWDITNYVSDFLLTRAGLEGCDCSATLH